LREGCSSGLGVGEIPNENIFQFFIYISFFKCLFPLIIAEKVTMFKKGQSIENNSG
jgi:hypothetical protein